MKKALLFVSCALLVAAMASCGNKNAEENTNDSMMDTTAVVDTTAAETESVEATEVATDANDAEMLSAAQKAGQAKCNCYKKDPASVESCIKALLSQSYAAYQNNEAFKAAMEKEYQKCIKEKVNAAATEATNKAKEAAKAEGNKAVKAAAADISKKLK